MFTQLEVKNNLLNVTQLQSKVDEIIFDYIDTSKNWGKAHKGLTNLFQQTVSFYTDYVREDGIPKGNVYWSVFLDVVARLIYFKTLAEKHLMDLKMGADLETIIEGFTVAANCLPNVTNDHELLVEISDSLKEVQQGENLSEAVIEKNNTLHDSLTILSNYYNKYTNTFEE